MLLAFSLNHLLLRCLCRDLCLSLLLSDLCGCFRGNLMLLAFSLLHLLAFFLLLEIFQVDTLLLGDLICCFLFSSLALSVLLRGPLLLRMKKARPEPSAQFLGVEGHSVLVLVG